MDYSVEDVEFLRHGDKPLLARLYRPHGPGPFRSVIELNLIATFNLNRLQAWHMSRNEPDDDRLALELLHGARHGRGDHGHRPASTLNRKGNSRT